MEKIDSLIKIIYPKTEISEKVFFHSKKNQVTKLILKNDSGFFSIICKYFVWGSAEKEESILQECLKKEIAVPKVIKRYKNILFLESLQGSAINSKNLFNELNAINESLLKNLALWLYKFHQSFKENNTTLIKSDMRLHNFILSGDSIFGIDFEESYRGDYKQDVAEMSATLCEMEIERYNAFSVKSSEIFAEKYFELSGEKIDNFREFIVNCLEKRRAYSNVRALNFFNAK